MLWKRRVAVRYWKVSLHGSGWRIPFESENGTVDAIGFYKTVAARANSSDEALLQAVRTTEAEISAILQLAGSRGQLEIVDIRPISPEQARDIPRTGFTFYAEE